MFDPRSTVPEAQTDLQWQIHSLTEREIVEWHKTHKVPFRPKAMHIGERKQGSMLYVDVALGFEFENKDDAMMFKLAYA